METKMTKPTTESKFRKIKCPICKIGILFEIEQVEKGIIRGKCSKCKTFSVYNAETSECIAKLEK